MDKDKKVETIKVYEHYGLEEDRRDVESNKIHGVDFLIGKEEDIKKLTRDMAGFGTEQCQKVIIEYDKGYGYFIAKRILMDYGTP